MRIDKFFSEQGLRSRSEIKKDIKAGFVSLNGKKVTKPEEQVDPEVDIISYKGQPVCYEKLLYYVMNKPAGYVTARTDNVSKTVMDLIKKEDLKKDLSPVGRLDKDTEGLLIITNDGELNHYLMSPKHHVSKTYYAIVEGQLGEEDVRAFEKGIDIGDEKICLPAKLEILNGATDEIDSTKTTEIRLTITEGRYHQVKRMVAARGARVVYLKRVAIGALKLKEELTPGNYSKLSKEELMELLGI